MTYTFNQSFTGLDPNILSLLPHELSYEAQYVM